MQQPWHHRRLLAFPARLWHNPIDQASIYLYLHRRNQVRRVAHAGFV